MALTSRQERLFKGDFPKEQSRSKAEKLELRRQRQVQRVTRTEGRILLIDDDPIFGKLMEAFALKQDMKLTAITDLESMDSLETSNYTAAIVDFDLGCVNGLEIAEYLENKIGAIPIVFVSSTDRTEELKNQSLAMETVFAHKSLGPSKILDQAQLLNMKKQMESDTNMAA